MMPVAVDTSTVMLNAAGVRSKGPTDKYAIEGIDLIHSRFGITQQLLFDLAVSFRLWQCRKVSVTELVDTNSSRKWSFKQHQCTLTKVWAPVNEAFKRFGLRCGTLLSQLQREVGIELLPESGAMCREARSLAALQVSQAARHEPHAVQDGVSEEITTKHQNLSLCNEKVAHSTDLVLNWTSWTYIGRKVSGLGRDSKTDEHVSTVRKVASCELVRYDEWWRHSNVCWSEFWQCSGHLGRTNRAGACADVSLHGFG